MRKSAQPAASSGFIAPRWCRRALLPKSSSWPQVPHGKESATGFDAHSPGALIICWESAVLMNLVNNVVDSHDASGILSTSFPSGLSAGCFCTHFRGRRTWTGAGVKVDIIHLLSQPPCLRGVSFLCLFSNRHRPSLLYSEPSLLWAITSFHILYLELPYTAFPLTALHSHPPLIPLSHPRLYLASAPRL